MIRAFALSLLLLASACVAPMRAPDAARAEVGDFVVEARFSLNVHAPQEQNVTGRLSWNHEAGSERLLFSDPLGQGVAELTVGAAGAGLRTANGRQWADPDPDKLLGEVLGYRLPVRQLSGWLLGRAATGDNLQTDAQGRPARLQQDGWRIEYGYDDDTATALPSRLTVSRPGELELRLRIETWRLP